MSRWAWGDARAVLRQVPIGGRHDDVGAEMLLQIGGAADVIDMTMGDERIFDLCRVQSELAQSADDLVLDRIGPDRIEQHDALRSR